MSRGGAIDRPDHRGEVAARAALIALDRRGFLRLAGSAAAAGLLPLGCGDAPEALHPPADLALRQLSPSGYATFTAAAMRLVGPAGAERIRTRRIDAARAADAWLDREPALSGPLSQALLLLEYGVPPLVAKWRRFTALDGAAQDAVLDDLMRSRLDIKRDVFKGLRSVALLAFYADPASESLTGYPGPFGGSGGIEAAMTYESRT
ncbi:MAG: hypothetical protein O7A09_09605 [Proteobacteria bacterium]|nr:hypothetical protein [Pseudomonadota bacterium]